MPRGPWPAIYVLRKNGGKSAGAARIADSARILREIFLSVETSTDPRLAQRPQRLLTGRVNSVNPGGQDRGRLMRCVQVVPAIRRAHGAEIF